MTRRNFLAATAAAAATLQAKTLASVGAQLYTVRSIIDAKPMETLKALEEIGYREAEVTLAGIDKIWPSLLRTKLKPVSLHMDTALFTKKQEELGSALDDAKKRGFQYVVCPYIAPADRGGVDVIKKLAETLNRAGEKCRAGGLALCYHNHAFEFEPVGSKILLDVLMEETDKRYVGLELDIFWSSVAGVDPVSILKKYSGRIPLLHLKNKAAGTEKLYKEAVPKSAFKEVGDGVIDIPAVLRASGPAGVKHFFVEQDQTPGNPIDSMRKSYEYLSKLNY
jgi:sugar phosphate isomerase/epimerase